MNSSAYSTNTSGSNRAEIPKQNELLSDKFLRVSLWICPRSPRPDGEKRGAKRPFSNLGIIGGLSSEPISVRKAKKSTQPQVCVCRNRPLSLDDLTYPLRRYRDLFSQAILADAHRL